MLEAYGFSRSGNCWKVRQILELTATPFKWIEVDSNGGETRRPAFLSLNPNGKVPIIRLDEGEVVTESNAILLHLAEGTAYLPSPGLARTRVIEWLFFEQYSHEPYIAVARNWIAYLKAKDKYADRLPEIWERGHRALGVMERRLATHAFLTDAGFTVADIALFAYTHMADEGEFDLTAYPGVRAWLGRVAALPGIHPIRPIPI
ncbi:MAG: glutathione S-transferase family protein [Hyphomicrobiaceae bacterium]